ncbi:MULTISPECIES: quinone oxidoreductase family protein [unclassified Rhizobium]|uniref:quinone oxidoreductase family protein n=1 Tax=unclassified Rhizobium TaxID=2613769 RepID=UPI001ADC32EE|nr:MULTISPECIES: zinc-binding alcohol dehydrogenase family protein [unclassified Rhizobium]MBO9127371.1 zinc-binding alcohol dehydrogenase family protein [Rhizobium sp. 16-488-2b]MBO9177814.1 zinc-binding alcohol dehydrogenase family protein [Rhizobium sp. 16-488-2a]
MKAAVYHQAGDPDVFRYEDVADPVPTDDEILIRVEAISIEGGDLVGRRDLTPGENEVPGYAAAGEIVQLGKNVKGFAVGQKVTTFNWKGSHAELRAAPASNCFAIPDGLDIGVASTIPVGPGTAAWALHLANLQPGQTVLVLGAAGGVGLATVQLAARMGARVIGTGTKQESLDRIREYGLDDGIVVGEQPVSEQVRALLGGNEVDVIIDTIGGPALVDALSVLKDGGNAVLIGVFGGRSTMINAGDLLKHRKTVIGCLLGPDMGKEIPRRLITDLFEMAKNGDLRVPIDATFCLSDAAAAHRRAEVRGRIGRVLMTA